METADKTTRTIAGHEITLQPGCRYVADRPWIERGRKVYPVSISLLGGTWAVPVFIVDNLCYDHANELLAAFNNGESSFEGRIWK